MNAEHELDWALENFPSVGIIPSPSEPAPGQIVLPLPKIHDMVHAAAVQAEGPVCGLINSDILLERFDSVLPLLTKDLDCGMVVFRRMEMEWPTRDTYKYYRFGYDVFLMDKRLSHELPDAPFTIGVPWWDLWLPFMAFLKGFNLCMVETPAVLHTAHETRWTEEAFVEYGVKLFEILRDEASAALADPMLKGRAEFVLAGLKMVVEALPEKPDSGVFLTALSKYFQWFFDEGGGVRRVTL